MGSLRSRIALLWAVLAAVCAAMLVILLAADRAGPAAQIDRAGRQTQSSCAAIRNAIDRLVPASDDGTSTLMDVVVDLSLREAYGVEGGIWSTSRGFASYAYPTYEGRVRKTDVPGAEMDSIAALARSVDDAHPTRGDVRIGEREAVVIAACALPRAQVAWTLTRVAAAQAATLQHMAAAAGVALGFVALAGAWLLLGLRRWSRKLDMLEHDLSGRADETARIEPKGERDLDRLVLAINTSAERIAALNADSERLARELAQADRLGGMGRVAAGLAHEIRNPLGAMRLRAENALAVQGDAALERRTGALAAVLATVDRIDGLVSSLLALTRPVAPARRSTDLDTWLRDAIAFRAEQAEQQGIHLGGEGGAGLRADIDAVALTRAVDNLLLNALQHTPRGGRVEVSLSAIPGSWRLCVDDSGPGIAPEMRDRLFEPFATGRPDGMGLGLATAFEIVAGHGGTLNCGESPLGGARFEMELPWHAS